MRATRSVPGASIAIALAAALIAGCAQMPPAEPAASPPAPTAPAPAVPAALPAPPASRAASGAAAFDARVRAQALALQAEQRWGEAASHWEMLALAHPGDSELARHAAQARERARSEGRARVSAATQAQARGDLDGATREYLRALVADPELEPAARALRALEMDRARRTYLARNNRGAPSPAVMASARSAPRADMAPAPEADVGAGALDDGVRLFRSGDWDGAIRVLQPYVRNNPADAEGRRYLRDALTRAARQRAAAGHTDEARELDEQARLLDATPATERRSDRRAPLGAIPAGGGR
jgi:tetratricopeptide (TPR) repeat protein